ncbi:MAG: hypothetical protein PG977_000657 [Bartonella clarridgeiae]|uniref:autotransporter outer membrane beta-barrel domain-containing protein n=1 Tax=Bartonella clarridgeiae TaxID=56426 RepID=UPI0023F46902|nr:autotransporter outer membrane beta-barrel domain-containing protein [Bartonella clarridgeiae]WCR55264.1 MAG: hypothetical protein PG977_000657 [Bartonella clarridgeiae]
MKWKVFFTTLGFLNFPLSFSYIQAASQTVSSVPRATNDSGIVGVIQKPIVNKHKIMSNLIGINADGEVVNATGYHIGGNAIAGVVCDNGCVVNLKDSTVNVQGMRSYGVLFKNSKLIEWKNSNSNGQNNSLPNVTNINQVRISNTKFLSPDIGVSSNGPGIVTFYNSEVRSDILLDDRYGMEVSYKSLPVVLLANHSVLEGKVNVTGTISTFLGLENSKWIIPANLIYGQGRQESIVNVLKLINSSIIFDKKVDSDYQTLYVKPPEPENNPPAVRPSRYTAVGDARVYLNVGSVDSDKLIIKTEVVGVTKVYINHVKDRIQATRAHNVLVSAPQEGITLIEAPGYVNKNAFKLPHGYITMDGLPYRHILKAIRTPAVSDNSTSLSNWHFKLQDGYIDSQSRVKALVPQMASYLVMPNALFSSGISDISNQNKVLADIRETLNIESKKKGSFFLSSYGNTASLSSIRNPIQYGYGADIGYAALQTGVVLGSFENENTITRVGLLGTYGKVSFTPKDMEDSAKSALDKWSISAFGSVQHDNNLYMNALLSYGIVKGHIKTAVINNVAELDDTKMFSVSTTVGQKLATGAKGVSFEPQAQLVYQSVMFNTILDSDNLQVNMKDPNQWLVRVGGRLTKTVPVVEKDSFISFYGKVNVMKTLSASDTIEVSDTFYLDSMGSAIEGGLGINVQVTKNILFHGDASYQQRLSKAGISGASFAGRLLYRF